MKAASFRCAPLYLLLMTSCFARADQSRLWGSHGESWAPTSRLPDFSFAGYQGNEQPIPHLSPVKNIKEFGATGNGQTDDSDAFLSAIELTSNGTILVPAGRYLLTKMIRVTHSNVVLRGEGADKTVLYFPKPLEETVGPGKQFAPGGAWSWSGGYLSFTGTNKEELVTKILKPTPRGSDILHVESAEKLQIGQRVRIVQRNTDGSLVEYLHGGKKLSPNLLKEKKLIDFTATIIDINDRVIKINRPLRVDVRTKWQPVLLDGSPTVENVGIEDLTIAFPAIPSAEHHKEPGFNAISFEQISNGWVRNVSIVNSDSGIILRSGTRFCSIEKIKLSAEPGREKDGRIGHHGILVGDLSQDNRVENFTIQGRFIHDLCVTSMASGNVFSKGQADDMTMDHHRKSPYENLFTELNLGKASKPWLSGGDEEAGPHSGARETFWNIKSAQPIDIPDWAIQFNLIGVSLNQKGGHNSQENWIEPADELLPSNLFSAQLEKRRHLKTN